MSLDVLLRKMGDRVRDILLFQQQLFIIDPDFFNFIRVIAGAVANARNNNGARNRCGTLSLRRLKCANGTDKCACRE
ncbi:MAG TPA: hypothetical protein VMH92_05220 [Acidocella sp.]|nr:hypothetical protein [Acidocella sp.]